MLIPGLQGSGSYYFGWRDDGQVYWWGPDLDLIGGLLIEGEDVTKSEEERKECIDFLESKGAVFSSISELLQYARSKNWPHLLELELRAGSVFSAKDKVTKDKVADKG